MYFFKFNIFIDIILLATTFFSEYVCYTTGRNILYGLSSFRHMSFDRPENLLKRVGITSHISSGLNTYLPFGQLLIDRLTNFIETKFINQIGAAKCRLPTLLPQTLLSEARKLEFGNTLFNVVDRNNRNYYLSPTSEEMISEVISQMGILPALSQPIYLFQSSMKYRDELRPCARSLRLREFLMFDLYSFHNSEECLDKSFKTITGIYRDIFNFFNITTAEKHGKSDLEFMTNIGDREVEIGHLFKLGTQFTEKINSRQKVYMGSYGIGLLRLLSAVFWNNKDDEGIILPDKISPFKAVTLDPTFFSEKIPKLNVKYTNDEILYDDRDGKMEDKLKDLRAIGIPKIIISIRSGVIRFWNRDEKTFTETEYT